LLKKLDRCVIRGIMFDWIHDYLSNRQQYVFLQNVSSFPIAVTYVFPQGSVLGQLLFLIYVNDIGNGLPFKTIKLYADDTNLFIFNKDVVTLTITANEYLFHLSQWFIPNRLSLNLDKTCFVTFGNTRNMILT